MQADVQVEQNRQHFYELSLEYVCKLQEIQERKKFEFVEPVSTVAGCPAGFLWCDGNGFLFQRSCMVSRGCSAHL